MRLAREPTTMRGRLKPLSNGYLAFRGRLQGRGPAGQLLPLDLLPSGWRTG